MKRISLLFFVCVTQLSCNVYAEEDNLRGLVFPTIPANVGDKIKHGMSEDEIAQLMNSPGLHQFSTIHSNALVRCVEYHRQNRYSGYYFVFTNSVLSFVCYPPDYDFIDVYDKKGKYVYSKSDDSDPQKRVRKVFDAEDLLLRDDFATLMIPPEKHKQSVDWGLTASYLLVSPLKVFSRNDDKQVEDDSNQAVKYAAIPFQIPLNTQREKVESLLGAPKAVHTNQNNDVFYFYGRKLELTNEYANLAWIAIMYTDDYVTSLFTAGFIDKDVIKKINGEE